MLSNLVYGICFVKDELSKYLNVLRLFNFDLGYGITMVNDKLDATEPAAPTVVIPMQGKEGTNFNCHQGRI